MIGRLLFGIIWFLLLYFGACAVTGAIVGARAAHGSTSQNQANVAAKRAATETVLEIRGYLAFGAATLALLGTFAGVLPGTKPDPGMG